MKIQYFILLKEAVTLQRMIQAENLMCACSRGGGGLHSNSLTSLN